MVFRPAMGCLPIIRNELRCRILKLRNNCSICFFCSVFLCSICFFVHHPHTADFIVERQVAATRMPTDVHRNSIMTTSESASSRLDGRTSS